MSEIIDDVIQRHMLLFRNSNKSEQYVHARAMFEEVTGSEKCIKCLVSDPRLLQLLFEKFEIVDSKMDINCSGYQTDLNNYRFALTDGGNLYELLWTEEERFDMSEKLRNIRKRWFRNESQDVLNCCNGICDLINDYAFDYY